MGAFGCVLALMSFFVWPFASRVYATQENSMRHRQLMEQFTLQVVSLQDELLLHLIMVRHLPLHSLCRTSTPYACPAVGGTTSPLEPAHKLSKANTHVSLPFKHIGVLDFRIESQAPRSARSHVHASVAALCTPRTALEAYKEPNTSCPRTYGYALCH
jgi:hypothetical protein